MLKLDVSTQVAGLDAAECPKGAYAAKRDAVVVVVDIGKLELLVGHCLIDCHLSGTKARTFGRNNLEKDEAPRLEEY